MMLPGLAGAQSYLYPLNNDMQWRTMDFLNADTTGFFTSLRPYTISELNGVAPLDSIWQPIVKDTKFHNTWVGRKLRKEHLLDVTEDDFKLTADPVFYFQLGKDSERTLYTNTKGVMVGGSYKDKFFFYTRFYENQARYTSYVDSFITLYQVVPGQGRVKFLDNKTYDFSQAYGGIGYTLNKHFNFMLAHDKIFIGDGYRSLLLSDNAYNYPFLKIDMSFWKFKYTVIYAVMQDLTTPHDFDAGFFKKYSTTHYLDINIGKKNRITAGIFETVMWKPTASRGYDLTYLNPMIFLRPVENSLDSPDNVLLGLNARWKMTRKSTLYAQVMLDEFIIDEVRSGRGWWGNKQGVQAGFKSASILGVKSLNFQTEVNFVRPYTYQHRSEAQNYTHHNQALAHPLGANFVESMTIVNYRWKNFFSEVKLQVAKTAQDTGSFNFGNDIFKNYLNHGDEYGHYLFDGLEGNLKSIEWRVDYLVNPSTNFNIEIGVQHRRFSNDLGDSNTTVVFFGLRTGLDNFYFDF